MSTVTKKRIPDEAKLGVAFLLAVVVFVLGLFYLKEWRITGGSYIIEALFVDVDGVGRSDPVLLGGVKIGKVESVRLENQLPVTELRIEDIYKLPIDSWLEVVDRTVMGSKALVVHKGTSAEIIAPGARIGGKTAPGLFGMVSKADSLSSSVQILLNSANALLDPKADQSIRSSLNNVNELTRMLLNTMSQEQKRVHNTMANMEKLSSNIQELSASEKSKISATLSNLEKTSAELDPMIARLQRTTTSLETILSRIEKGEGTIGKLINDDKLYNDMNRLMVNLDGLVMDLKTNPKRYLNISVF